MSFVTTFVGLDEDAVGEGDTTETVTVDTWIQHRIQWNNEAILTPAAGVCFSPISGNANAFTDYDGIRPYCSFRWHTVWRGYIIVYQDQTDIEVTFCYHAQMPGNTNTSDKVFIRFALDDGTLTDGVALANTYSGGTTTGHQTFTVPLAERARRTRLMRVTIMTRSDTIETVARGTSATTSSTSYMHYPYKLRDSQTTATPGFFDPNSAGTSPDGDSLEACYLYVSSAPAAFTQLTGKKYDMLWASDNGSDGTQAGTVLPVAQVPASYTMSLASYMHYCLMLRALFIRPVFRSFTAPTPASAFMDRGRLQPIIEFGSGEATEQIAMLRRAALQPYVALVGPRGRIGNTSFAETDMHRLASNNYPAHWPTILGDFDDTQPEAGAGNTGQHRDLINEGIWLRTENPRLQIKCIWLSCQQDAQFNRNETSTTTTIKKDGLDAEGFEAGVGPGEATWLLDATIEQLSDAASGTGDWDSDVTSYGSIVDETVKIPVWGADVIGTTIDQPPVLRGADSNRASAKNDTTDAGFWFREGSLFPNEGDLDVLHETSHFVELSSLTSTELAKPFRLKLSMELSDFNDPVDMGQTDAVKQDNLRLTLVSCVVVEWPQEP